MSEGVAPQLVADGADANVQRLTGLLSDALTLCDALALPPEIGARLQDVIDKVGNCVPSTLPEKE